VRLREAGVAVISAPALTWAHPAFATLLRQIIGRYGQRRAEQSTAARTVGGTVVDLGGQTGAVFRADAGTLCHDGFHPSADGYRIWAHALLPAVTAALPR
jgi:lysophospholipase L1-like esterase